MPKEPFASASRHTRPVHCVGDLPRHVADHYMQSVFASGLDQEGVQQTRSASKTVISAPDETLAPFRIQLWGHSDAAQDGSAMSRRNDEEEKCDTFDSFSHSVVHTCP